MLDLHPVFNYHTLMGAMITSVTTAAGTLVLIGLYIILDIMFAKQIFAAKNICFGVFSFFAAFIIAGGSLFALGAYSLWLTYGICFIIAAGGSVYFYFKNVRVPVTVTLSVRQEAEQGEPQGDARGKPQGDARGKPQGDAQKKTQNAGQSVFLNVKRDIGLIERKKGLPQGFVPCIIALLAAGLVFSAAKFEHPAMGQDQGSYLISAIYRTAGHNDVQIDLPGYHALQSEQDKEMFLAATNASRTYLGQWRGNMMGFYLNSHNHFLPYAPVSDVSGYMHGIPGYGALLSVSGRIFGIPGMLHIQTLSFLAAIGLFFLTLSVNLKLKLSVSAVMTALFILSPIVLWITKSSLTEAILILFITAFIYLITSSGKHANKLLWLPAAAFAFLHVSIYTMMPVFFIVFIILYMQKRDDGIIASCVISLTAFLGGFFMMLYTSNGYTLDNYKLFRRALPFLDLSSYTALIIFISAVTAAAIGIAILLRYLIKRFDITLNSKVFLTVCKYAVLACLVYLLYNILDGFVLHFIYEMPHNMSSVLLIARALISSAPGITLIAYALLSGFIILPVAIVAVLAKKEALGRPDAAAATVMFIYCIIIYSAFLRRDVEYFYYFARYLAPFIPLILVIGAVYTDKMRVKASALISYAALLLTIPFSMFIFFNKDSSRMEMDTFAEIIAQADALEENDIIVVSDGNIACFFLPLNAMTDCIILTDDKYGLIDDKLANPGTGRVFYLSQGREHRPEGALEYKTYRSTYPVTPGILPPLPLSVEREEYSVFFGEVRSADEWALIG